MYSPCSVQLLGHSTVTVDTLQELKGLNLSESNVTDAGIRGLELIPTLEEINLSRCTKVHDLSALRNRAGLQIIAPDNTILR
jgi:hypothetical protein